MAARPDGGGQRLPDLWKPPQEGESVVQGRTRYPWWYIALIGAALILAGVMGWVIASQPAYAYVMGGLGLLLIAIGAYRAKAQ